MDGYVDDANRARGAVPEGAQAEKQGEQAGLEGGKFEEAVCIIYYPSLPLSLVSPANITKVSNPRASGKPDERIPEYTTDGKSRVVEMRDDATQKFNKGVNQMDQTVEQKASEAKGTLSGWFGGK